MAPIMSRRKAIGRLAFYGGAMAALAQQAALARSGSSGSYSTAAVALPGTSSASGSDDDVTKAVKIARAIRAGPLEIARNATVAELDHHGNPTNVLRAGSNEWICVPGDENQVGDPPMCVDQLGLQWFKDAHAGKPAPTNSAPGLCYMLCGERSTATTRHSTTPAQPSQSAHIGWCCGRSTPSAVASRRPSETREHGLCFQEHLSRSLVMLHQGQWHETCV